MTGTTLRRFRNRSEAGRLLADELREYSGRDDVIVLGLPRGGVPVGHEIARALGAALDVFVVRKLGIPGQEEAAFGAIATGGTRVINKGIVEELDLPEEWIEAIDARERRELERRERAYRPDRPPPDLAGKIVIMVDDGVATGSTMLAAIAAARDDDPKRVVVAVPVADPDVCEAVRVVADEAVCLSTPRPLHAVGAWYDDFSQVTDEQVRQLLDDGRPPDPVTEISVRPLTGVASDLDPLIARARWKSFVLLGEPSHGTHEAYRYRAEITRRLITEGGVTAVAVEADWPDAYRVSAYVRAESEDRTAEAALSGFRRFPAWMWRNTEVAEFVRWLREWNDALPAGATKVGFYGLDLYSLHASIEAVVEYLERVDPDAAQRARERYACFEQFGRDPLLYAYEAGIGGAEPCEEQAIEQLLELRDMAAERASQDGHIDEDGQFYAEQNARLVIDAEEYYRSMFRGGVESWNLRDRHMADTLDSLVAHLERAGEPVSVAVWEHNSHLGDNRATELGQAGQLNVGQFVRERHTDDSLLVGFTTYTGTVTAASDWGGDAERRHVRRALPGSWEEFFHEHGGAELLIDADSIRGRRLERAIGVVYRPETERISHYFYARLGEQFDAVIHVDETHAVEPLERTSEWETGELPAAYPWGI